MLLKTSDSLAVTATSAGLLGDLLWGHITRVVRLCFGVVDPELRDKHASVVENVHHTRRMDKTEDEIFALRALPCNTTTETHQDTSDWIGSLTQTTPLGNLMVGFPEESRRPHANAFRGRCVFAYTGYHTTLPYRLNHKQDW